MESRWQGFRLTSVLFHLGGAAVTPVSLGALAATVLLALGLGVVARRGVQRVLRGRHGVAHAGSIYALGRIAQYLVVAVGLLVGCENVGLSLTTFAAFGAVLGVGIGFGLQNIAQNFICGLILLIERPVQKGDFVKVGDTVGTVDEIAMRATRVLSRDGVAIIVPNSELISGVVINQSAGAAQFRTRIAVGVAYGSDTSAVRATLLEVARGDARIRTEPAPHVFFRDFGASALAFELAVWLDEPEQEPRVTSDLRYAIDTAFRARGIEMPFPQCDVHLVGTGAAQLTP